MKNQSNQEVQQINKDKVVALKKEFAKRQEKIDSRTLIKKDEDENS